MSDNFDIDFTLLPPELQIRLWILALDADTSKVNIKYTAGGFTALTYGFSYNYGGAVEASLSMPLQSYKLGYDPGTSDLTAGGVYRGFRFNLSTNTATPKVGLTLGYGRALLPFPSELQTTFTNANTGFMSVVDQVRAYPDNPLKWYDLESDDKKAIDKAIKTGGELYKQSTAADRFGAGMRLSYDPKTGLMIFLGVQGSF